MPMTCFAVVSSLLCLTTALGPFVACAQSPPRIPAGTGFGADTPGGRGGTIYRVTNLEATGAGSLRAALEAEGPRLVVFEVGGVLDLNGRGITISQPRVTVAGQTAPSPGITIIRGAVYIATHDVRIQHIRVRPGDAGRAKRPGRRRACRPGARPLGRPWYRAPAREPDV